LSNAITPDHYNQTKVTCIEAIRDLCKVSKNDHYTDYNRFQAFKYVWRAGSKDDVLQDLKKARQFLDFAIEALEEERGLK